MKALVVYESMSGNTATVASAVADGIARSGMEIRARPVTDVGLAEAAEADLLVVDGPTHAHGMSRPSTRKTAAADKENAFPHPTVTPGLRDWIAELPGGHGRLAAAFDTRIDKPVLLTGSAARGIGRRLGVITSSPISSASSCRRTTACSRARSNTPCDGGATSWRSRPSGRLGPADVRPQDADARPKTRECLTGNEREALVDGSRTGPTRARSRPRPPRHPGVAGFFFAEEVIMRRHRIPVIAIGILAMVASSCDVAGDTTDAVPSGATRVVVDTDMGPDDVMALLFLLAREDVVVEAVTVSGTGLAHCEGGMRTARAILASAGAPETPVACGRSTPLAGLNAFPEEWRAYADDFAASLDLMTPAGAWCEGTAVELLIETLDAETTLLTLGPLTNVAERRFETIPS